MRKTEALFLTAVIVFAAVFAAFAFRGASVPSPPSIVVQAASAPAAVVPEASPAGVGRPRDLDSGQIRRRIRQRGLSDREAEFYTPMIKSR